MVSILQVPQGDAIRREFRDRTTSEFDSDPLPMSSLRVQVLQILVDDQLISQSPAPEYRGLPQPASRGVHSTQVWRAQTLCIGGDPYLLARFLVDGANSA